MDRTSKYKIIDTFFPNGNKYMTHVFENDVVLSIKKYYLTGELQSVCEYQNGSIINKKIFKKNNRICEYLGYHYDHNDNLYKIIKEEEYVTTEIKFKRDENNKITEITLFVNDTLSRKYTFYYNNNKIYCTESYGENTNKYQLPSEPIANDKWLLDKSPESLVMRKLKLAKQLIA